MPTLTELHDAALRGDLDLPARTAGAAAPTRQATTLTAAHAAGALQIGPTLDEALTLYLRSVHADAARLLERTDVAFADADHLPRALLAVLCYLQLHGKGERRGTQSAAEYLRKKVLPTLKDRDADGRTSQLRDAIHNTLRT